MSERGKVENILSELGKKIDGLVEETKKAGNNISVGTEKKIRDLKAQKEKLEDEFKSYSSKRGEKWEHTKIHLNKAVAELKKAAEAFFRKGGSV